MKRKPEPHQRPPAMMFHAKSKKAGVEIDPDLKTRVAKDAAALDAVMATRPMKPPGSKR